MKVQTKVLLLLLTVTVIFVGGLFAFRGSEQSKLRRLAADRAAERDLVFSKFLEKRGDQLNVVVDEYSIWDDAVQALRKHDKQWAETNLREETLTTYQINAAWLYRQDRTLLFSLNNRYAAELNELPLPQGSIEKLFEGGKRTCHFFLHVPQGWMEIRGATVHPSHDRFRETRPEGYFFAGQIWITDYMNRIAEFTGYTLSIEPLQPGLTSPPASAEELGHIRFSRLVHGWDGQPIARIVAENDSPLIREMNQSSRRLLNSLLTFAALLVAVVAGVLVLWVRGPLHKLCCSLETGDIALLGRMAGRRDEWGMLANQIIAFRRTQEKLEAAEEQLRHSQKLEAVGRLAGGVAHDFNNLLTAILGYSQLLERKLQRDPTALEQIRLVFRAGEQAAGLTRQLLAFSRKQMLQPKVIDLNKLVGDVRRLLQRVIGEHIELVFEIAATEPRVLADPGQVEQVLMNLGVNARDAMPGGGTLTFRTGNVVIDAEGARLRGGDIPPGNYIFLEVSDTGQGMDGETKARIFEPFFTTKGPGRGTGLGLATVYGIVKQSQGAITVQSEPGKGATFRVELPQVQTECTPVIAPPSVSDSHEGSATILAVEDEEVVRMVICSVLEQAGYEVLCASNPTRALELACEHENQIDLLLTDVVMPQMSGPVLAEEILEISPKAKVLYISGYSERDMRDQGITGDLEVMPKPFTRETLLQRVKDVLEEKSEEVPA